MEDKKLDKILADHKKWLAGEGGNHADLRHADLHHADLRRADLSRADLRHADLRHADLSDADLRRADLRGADLRGADLRGADLDFSCLPLWCGGTKFKIDEKVQKQLLWHALHSMKHNDNKLWKSSKKLIDFANEFHRVGEVDKL